MSIRIIVFQHVAHEILGIFHPLLKQDNARIKYVNFAINTNTDVSLNSYNSLIILGGI